MFDSRYYSSMNLVLSSEYLCENSTCMFVLVLFNVICQMNDAVFGGYVHTCSVVLLRDKQGL